jgi:putative hydrolase of the HAD superfamily
MARRAILLDALGTLLELQPPVARLRTLLAERHAIDVTPEQAATALRAEMAHYRNNCVRASDAQRLHELRLDCAAVVLRELGDAAAIAPAEFLPTLLESIAFVPFPEVPATLAAWRGRGLRLVVASNWDVSLHDVLRRTGLDALLDGVVTSAEVGASKPDPALFAAALAVADASPAEALHVGDALGEDVEGARAAGIEAVWLRRGGGGFERPDVRTARTLAEVEP